MENANTTIGLKVWTVDAKKQRLGNNFDTLSRFSVYDVHVNAKQIFYYKFSGMPV